jgi:hypothetical protein
VDLQQACNVYCGEHLRTIKFQAKGQDYRSPTADINKPEMKGTMMAMLSIYDGYLAFFGY